jgi:four helix bundle protein
MELETQLLIAERLDYITSDEATKVLNHAAEVGKILHGLIASLER